MDLFSEIFSRQMLLPQIGVDGQHALMCAHVAVVGVGAVGGRTAELLCRAGVGRITIIDSDKVELSNLARQTLYTFSDAQNSEVKVEAFRRHLNQIMPECHVYPKNARLTPDNVSDLIGNAHVVADGTDNMETRFVVNQYCVSNNIPWVYAGAVGTRASVFPVVGKGACLRCIFPEKLSPSDTPNANDRGVLGSATAMAASWSATLIIRILLGDKLESVFRTWDLWTGEMSCMEAEKMKMSNRSVCDVCGK
jgi:molybdopterin-synthase adenylyltransferase